MARNHLDREDVLGVEHPVEVGPDEPNIGDQRPRERRYNARVRKLVAAGSGVGAVAFVVIVWIINLVRHAHGSEWKLYLFAIACGIVAGPVVLPYIGIFGADGRDARIVARRTAGRSGQADTPLAGAEAVDQARVEAGVPPPRPPDVG